MFTSSIFISFGTQLIQSIVSFISGHVPFYIGSIANGTYSCILYSKLYTNICPLIIIKMNIRCKLDLECSPCRSAHRLKPLALTFMNFTCICCHNNENYYLYLPFIHNSWVLATIPREWMPS
jgi:hypothetical protein